MSLNWNVKNLAFNPWVKGVELPMGGWRYATDEDDPKDVGDYLNPITEALIWATLGVEFTPAKEKDLAEFCLRVRMWEKVNGPLISQRSAEAMARALKVGAIREDSFTHDGYLSYEELRRHVGLITNVCHCTKAQFAKKLEARMREDVVRDFNREGEVQ